MHSTDPQECPWETLSLPQTFLKGKDLPCHIPKGRTHYKVQTLGRVENLYEDPGKSRGPSQSPGKAPTLPHTFMKGRDYPCHIAKMKDPVQGVDLFTGAR